MTARKKPKLTVVRQERDVLETMRDELAEAVELMRRHFPKASESDLLAQAEAYRSHRYHKGRWPDFAALAEQERIAEQAKQELIEEGALS